MTPDQILGTGALGDLASLNREGVTEPERANRIFFVDLHWIRRLPVQVLERLVGVWLGLLVSEVVVGCREAARVSDGRLESDVGDLHWTSEVTLSSFTLHHFTSLAL